MENMDDDYTFLVFCPYCGGIDIEPIEDDSEYGDKYKCLSCEKIFYDFN